MASNDASIHKRLPRLLVELEDLAEGVDKDDARRFVYWRMRNAAWAALEAGMTTAGEIIEAVRALRHAETQSGDSK